jgi:hypothetical protein
VENATIYEGGWRDDKRHGHGSLTYGKGIGLDSSLSNGPEYRFKSENGNHFLQGCRYEGGWEDDEKHGTGTVHYVKIPLMFDYWDLSPGLRGRYVGEWKEGKMTGRGTLYFEDGSTVEDLVVDPGNSRPEKWPSLSDRVHNEWAKILMKEGDSAEAMLVWKELVLSEESKPAHWLGLSWALHERRQWGDNHKSCTAAKHAFLGYLENDKLSDFWDLFYEQEQSLSDEPLYLIRTLRDGFGNKTRGSYSSSRRSSSSRRRSSFGNPSDHTGDDINSVDGGPPSEAADDDG